MERFVDARDTPGEKGRTSIRSTDVGGTAQLVVS